MVSLVHAVVLGGIFASGFAFKQYYAPPAGRMNVDRIALKLPISQPVAENRGRALCRTLSTLLASGVAILEALEITARTAGNAVVEEAIVTTRRSIERGETIAQPLKETAVFPPMVVQMIGVGEATGALDTMLGKIADFYEEEVDVAVAGLLTLMEPLMISLLGGIVGGSSSRCTCRSLTSSRS
jgi:type IV pilus assembly protein PilC